MAPVVEFPETHLVPIKSDGAILSHGGWILIFRNQLRGKYTPIEETVSRMVSFKTSDGQIVDNMVSWTIIRTPNAACEKQYMAPCPDTIRVVYVPQGFLAVPESVRVDEGKAAKILIIRNVIG